MRNIQATGNLFGEQITIKQISKAKARRLFIAGETIYLQSSNMRPFNMWQSVYPVQIEGFLSGLITDPEKRFFHLVADYRYYYCDSERGKYVTFYERIK